MKPRNTIEEVIYRIEKAQEVNPKIELGEAIIAFVRGSRLYRNECKFARIKQDRDAEVLYQLNYLDQYLNEKTFNEYQFTKKDGEYHFEVI